MMTAFFTADPLTEHTNLVDAVTAAGIAPPSEWSAQRALRGQDVTTTYSIDPKATPVVFAYAGDYGVHPANDPADYHRTITESEFASFLAEDLPLSIRGDFASGSAGAGEQACLINAAYDRELDRWLDDDEVLR